MNKCFELEIDDPGALPSLIDFEILKRMKEKVSSFNVPDIRLIEKPFWECDEFWREVKSVIGEKK